MDILSLTIVDSSRVHEKSYETFENLSEAVCLTFRSSKIGRSGQQQQASGTFVLSWLNRDAFRLFCSTSYEEFRRQPEQLSLVILAVQRLSLEFPVQKRAFWLNP